MKFAVICSAGGGAFFAAYDILMKVKRYSEDNFILITDRVCKAEQEAINRGIEFKRIPFLSKEQFSVNVAELLIKKEVSMVLMLYDRMISADIFLTFPTLNIHPALLPVFKGINAVGQAFNAKVKFIGATMHITTDKMDNGAIVAQVVSPVKLSATKVELDKLSFLQKCYLIVVMLDCFWLNLAEIVSGDIEVKWNDEVKFSCSANPCIQSNDLKEMFDSFQDSLGMGDFIK